MGPNVGRGEGYTSALAVHGYTGMLSRPQARPGYVHPAAVHPCRNGQRHPPAAPRHLGHRIGRFRLLGPVCHTNTSTFSPTGREVRENLFEQVADLLHGLDEGMVPISVFFPYLPIPVHKKRDKWVCEAGAGGRSRREAEGGTWAGGSGMGRGREG